MYNDMAPLLPAVGQQQIYGFGVIVDGEETPSPEPPSQAQDWHASVTPDLRNQLVGKLVKELYPYPHPIRDLLTNARKMEKDMFEEASDKEAYLHMLAEKIDKIQKELEERKQQRMQQQQQHRAVSGIVGESAMMDGDGGRQFDSTIPMQQSLGGQSQNNDSEQELREGIHRSQQQVVMSQVAESVQQQVSSMPMEEVPSDSSAGPALPPHLSLHFIFKVPSPPFNVPSEALIIGTGAQSENATPNM